MVSPGFGSVPSGRSQVRTGGLLLVRQDPIRHESRTRAKNGTLCAYQYAIQYGPERAFETLNETTGGRAQ